MRRTGLIAAAAAALLSSAGAAQTGPYSVLKKVKVGGAGGFDYVYADVTNRRLYIPRSGQGARITIYDLDTFDSAGVIPSVSARGTAIDPKSNHGFVSSKPVVMFDAKTMAPIKSIDVQGGPDGIMFDPYNERVWVLSHSAPNATIINAADGTVVGTLDLGGAPEQAVSDGKGHVYIDIEDKANVAVVDAKTLTVTTHYDITGKGGTCAGLAFDAKNRILVSTCRNPANAVVLSADDGHVITTLPIGTGTDGAFFNSATNEFFSSNGGDGTLTVIKESSPTSFAVEQNLPTTAGAKTLTFDSKTGHIILIAAELGEAPPPPAAGGRGGRRPMIPDSFTIWVVGKP